MQTRTNLGEEDNELMLTTAAKDNGVARPVRVHSHRPVGDTPKTPGERMTQRRKELGLRQEDVASQIKFVRKDAFESTMSRSAYCMYESDSVTMDIERVALIAKVLKTTPEYLAYGVSDENALDEVELSHGEFVHVGKWKLNDDWLYERYEAEASELALIRAPVSHGSLTIGDMAVVRLGAKPSASSGDFVFAEDGKVKIASVARPSRTADYSVLSKDGKPIRQLDDSVVFLGKVIGSFG